MKKNQTLQPKCVRPSVVTNPPTLSVITEEDPGVGSLGKYRRLSPETFRLVLTQGLHMPGAGQIDQLHWGVCALTSDGLAHLQMGRTLNAGKSYDFVRKLSADCDICLNRETANGLAEPCGRTQPR